MKQNPHLKRLGVALLATIVLAGAVVGLTGGVFVSGTVPLDATDGPQIDVVTSSESELVLDGPDGPNTVEVVHEKGSITFESNGPSSAEIDTGNIEGTTTRVDNIDAPNSLTMDPADKGRAIAHGDLSYLQWGNVSLGDGNADFTYSSSSTVDISIEIDPSQGVEVVDSNGNQVDTGVADSDGMVRLTVPSGTNKQMFLRFGPSFLEIRDETNPDQLVTGTNATIEFYPQGALDEIITRPVENGRVDMSCLPTDQPFIAVANAEGYSNRRIFVESFEKAQQIYLISDTADTVEVEYDLEDFSGSFPDDRTVLQLERNIGGEWRNVQGDFFGATGRWDGTLKRDVRHKLTLINLDTGEQREVGQVTPQISGVNTITVDPGGEVTIAGASERVIPNPALGSIQASDPATFGVEIREGETAIDTYAITVEHIASDGTATTLETRSGTGTNTERFDLNLTGLDGSVQAEVDLTMADGATKTATVKRDIRANYPAANGLLGGLLDIGSGLGATEESGPSPQSSMASFLISLLVTAAVARSTRSSSEVTGLVTLGSMAFFQMIGWLASEVLFAVAATFGAMILIRQRV